MMQALVTLIFAVIAIGAVTLMSRLLRQDWDAVCAALGLRQKTECSPLSPRYRVNARRATCVRMEATPLRRAA